MNVHSYDFLSHFISHERAIRHKLAKKIIAISLLYSPSSCRYSSCRQQIYELLEKYDFPEYSFGRMRALLEMVTLGKMTWEDCRKRLWINVIYWEEVELSFRYFVKALEDEIKRYEAPPDEDIDYCHEEKNYYCEPEYEKYVLDLEYQMKYNQSNQQESYGRQMLLDKFKEISEKLLKREESTK